MHMLKEPQGVTVQFSTCGKTFSQISVCSFSSDDDSRYVCVCVCDWSSSARGDMFRENTVVVETFVFVRTE